MGCDIHLKLERRKKGESEWQSVKLTQDRCWGYRIYGMFAHLANVRNFWDAKPIPQRGFPTDACFETQRAYCYEVKSDDDYAENEEKYDGWDYDYINETLANKWVADGLSVEMHLPFPYEDKRMISGPDWHSPNWCTTEEMRQCVKECFYLSDGENNWHGDFVEWFSLLGAMEGIEKYGFYECRAVFWFDN